RDLIRIDTSNPGDGSGPGGRVAAEYVAEKLAGVGREPQVFESEPRRTSVGARIEGTDPGRDALLLQGHLDVGPVEAGDWARHPPRDVVLAFTADGEAGGGLGAAWLVENHPALFEGCTEASGEVGGFSISLSENERVYAIEAAEKGIAWMRLTARGRAGHGSMLSTENAVTELAEAVARIGRYRWPVRLTPTVRSFFKEAFGIELTEEDTEA